MEKMKIQVDDREPEHMLLNLATEGVDVERKRMIVGDYVCGETVVERKQIDDFCSSLCDGRLKKQVEAMKMGFENVFVLVSGHVKDRKGGVHENCILGALVSLVVKHGVTVLMLDDDDVKVYWADVMLSHGKMLTHHEPISEAEGLLLAARWGDNEILPNPYEEDPVLWPIDHPVEEKGDLLLPSKVEILDRTYDPRKTPPPTLYFP